MRWLGTNIDEVRAFMHPSPPIPLNGFAEVDAIGMMTAKGLLTVNPGDWILRTLLNELVTLSDAEFARTLERVD